MAPKPFSQSGPTSSRDGRQVWPEWKEGCQDMGTGRPGMTAIDETTVA